MVWFLFGVLVGAIAWNVALWAWKKYVTKTG